jgi:hypothetical protein
MNRGLDVNMMYTLLFAIQQICYHHHSYSVSEAIPHKKLVDFVLSPTRIPRGCHHTKPSTPEVI